MTDVDATLVVDDGAGGSRALSINDFKAAATLDATEATLAAFKTANHTDQLAVIAKLSSDPATQTTLAALLVQATAIAASVAGTVAVSAASLPLPSGAATAAKQDTGNTSVASIDTKTPALASGRVPVDPSGVTSPVSAASLPLPSGAAQEHATAASPHSARLTDGTTYLGSTAQRLHVDDGGSSLSVDDNGGSLTVDGTFWQATQPVSGPLTDTQLRASAPPVDQSKVGGTAIDTNSGNKSAGTQRVVLATDQPALTTPLPVGSSVETGTVCNGTTALTPKYAFANIAASQTDSQIVALVSSKKIRVLALYCLTGATATTITLQSNATAKTALFANGANGGEVLPFNPAGWFETASGEALKATTGAGSTTGIGVVYVEV